VSTLNRLSTLLILFGFSGTTLAAPAPPVITSSSYTYSFAGVTNDVYANDFQLDVEDFSTTGATSVIAQFPDSVSPFAQGAANANFGVLGASAQAFAQAPSNILNPGTPGGFVGIGGAMFTDGYTITGGSGIATTSVTLTGAIGAASNAVMVYVLLKSATPFTDLEAIEIAAGDFVLAGVPLPFDVVHATLASPAFPLDPVVTGTYSYTSGVPVYLAGMLLTYAEQSGSANFLTTAKFGISAPAGGMLVTDSTIAYAQAVPEAGSWLLLTAGLVLIGAVRVRRSRRE